MQTKTEVQIMLSAWQDDFQAHLEALYHHKSPKTVALAAQHVRVFSKWYEAVYQEAFDPSRLTSHALERYRDHSLNEARVSADTWNSRLWALRVLCNSLGLPELMEDIQIKKTGSRPARHRSLTKIEYLRFVDQLELGLRGAVTRFEYQVAARDQAALGLMLWAGLRVAEVCDLDLDDVVLNERSGTVRIRHGKGDKERILALNKYARKALASWLELRLATGDQALFSGKGTSRLSTRQLERVVKETGRIAGIQGVTPHWLRYTFAKRLERSATIEQIRDLLGHASIETTRRYLRSGFDELQSVLDAAF